jgi:GTP pyrophosphokinase
MCEKEFRKYRLNFNTLVKSEEMEKAVVHFGFKSAEDLIASVGYGKITPLQIIRRIEPKSEAEPDANLLDKIIDKVRKKKDKGGVTVKGLDDILVRFGKCCQPVPGDAITGYITQGQGVTIHRTNCVNALKMNPERQIEVAWDDAIGDTYPVRILVRSMDRVGLLADLAGVMSKIGANIVSANTEVHDDKTVDGFFTVQVGDIEHLDRLTAAMRKVKGVLKVRRLS